jgi:adenylate cyclase
MGRAGRNALRWLNWLLPLAILLAALAAWTSQPTVLVELRNLVFDSFIRFAPRAYEPAPVTIVDIDDASLEKLGQWPWPRTELARLVSRLDALGAASIALDILLSEPDRTSPATMLRDLPELPATDPLAERLKALPDHDAALAAALGKASVVTGFAGIDRAGGRLPALKSGFAFAGDNPAPFLPNFPGATADLPALEAAAKGNGSVNDIPDTDGMVRRVPLLVAIGNKVYPSLSAEALRVGQGASSFVVKSSGANGVAAFGQHTGVDQIKIGALLVPTDAEGQIWIRDTGHQPQRFVPAWKIFEPGFDAAAIKDHVVLVGTSAAGLKDLRATPLDPAAPGVELHAQAIEQMLLGEFLQRPDWAQGAELVYMLVLGILLMILLPRVGASWAALAGGASVAGAIGASWYLYREHSWLLDPVYPSLVCALVYVTSSSILYLRTELERQSVRNAFSRYLSPSIVEQLARHPERLALGGEMREMTLLFSDIRGFTTISESFDAQGLTSFMNHYLTPMTDVILAKAGTIDKYMGDAIMAFWNAPLDDARHAENGCRAALAMRAELVRLNEGWRAEADAAGRRPLEVRIGVGLNTGVCCVGNMGSDQRFDYSVLGDDVNLASRLEGQSKTYGVDIVIGEATATQVPHLAMLELDLIKVKGKTRPVRVFALIGDERIGETAAFAALKTAHDGMLAAYRTRQWAEARRALDSCRAEAPDSLRALYALYDERIALCESAPPPPDWDGVFVALTK